MKQHPPLDPLDRAADALARARARKLPDEPSEDEEITARHVLDALPAVVQAAVRASRPDVEEDRPSRVEIPPPPRVPSEPPQSKALRNALITLATLLATAAASWLTQYLNGP